MSEVPVPAAQHVSLARALALEGAGGTYVGEVRAEWTQGRAAFGGIVAGQLVRALELHVPSERSLRSALFDFVAPTAVGKVTIEASVLREGRALTHAQARLVQNGSVCALLTAAYGAPRPSPVQVAGSSAPVIAPPEQLARLPYIEGVLPRCTQHFDYRWGSGRIPFSGSDKGQIGGYVRHPSGGPVDAAGVLALIDGWPPALLALLKRPAPTSTVTWMVDILAPLPASGSESDAFYRYEADTVAAAEGYGSCDARLWDPSGQLIAASRQFVVEFS
jgi:acyl-CoA thioesterase